MSHDRLPDNFAKQRVVRRSARFPYTTRSVAATQAVALVWMSQFTFTGIRPANLGGLKQVRRCRVGGLARGDPSWDRDDGLGGVIGRASLAARGSAKVVEAGHITDLSP